MSTPTVYQNWMRKNPNGRKWEKIAPYGNSDHSFMLELARDAEKNVPGSKVVTLKVGETPNVPWTHRKVIG